MSLGQGLWARAGSTYGERDIVAAYCRLDSAVFAVGLTAARLWGFPLPGIFDKDVASPPAAGRRVGERTVYRPRGNGVDRRIHLGTSAVRRKETALVRWSQMTTDPAELISGPELTTPDHLVTGSGPASGSGLVLTSRVRTLLDLSSILDPDALVIIGDHLVRRPRPRFEDRHEPYATIEQLQHAAAQFTGRGVVRLRATLREVRMSSDSPAETRLRLAFQRAGLPEPRANAPAREAGRDGEPALDLGEPDLHWPRWRVAVEHEGPSHLDAEQLPRDIDRGERRAAAGWIEVRTTARDLRSSCAPAIARVRAALTRRGWRP